MQTQISGAGDKGNCYFRRSEQQVGRPQRRCMLGLIKKLDNVSGVRSVTGHRVEEGKEGPLGLTCKRTEAFWKLRLPFGRIEHIPEERAHRTLIFPSPSLAAHPFLYCLVIM